MSESKLFKPLENEQGFLKMGIMGAQGSGKTFTAVEAAIGLRAYTKDPRPIYGLDTEGGLSYLKEKFDEKKVPAEVAKTRAFVDLLAGIAEAEKHASVLLIDSVTHYWQELQDAFKKKKGRTTLRMQDWGELKGPGGWGNFTRAFLDSRLHIVMCGRAGDDFESVENDEGKLEYHKVGTKMQAEKNLGYEPGLALEMERVPLDQPRRGQRNFANRAYVLKDRFDIIDGQFFDNPTFESFLPHIKRLNLGVHGQIAKTDSTELFDKNSDKNYFERKKQVEIFLEEIQGELTSAYPGQSAEEKRVKADLIQEAFGTRSWKALEDYAPEKLKEGLTLIRSKIQTKKQEAAA